MSEQAEAISPRMKLLTIDQVAEATGLSPRYIQLEVKRKKFPRPIPFGRRKKWLAITLIKFMESKDRTAGNR
jgi:predicted DNA-binding transcriptional regulator AlpA